MTAVFHPPYMGEVRQERWQSATSIQHAQRRLEAVLQGWIDMPDTGSAPPGSRLPEPWPRRRRGLRTQPEMSSGTWYQVSPDLIQRSVTNPWDCSSPTPIWRDTTLNSTLRFTSQKLPSSMQRCES